MVEVSPQRGGVTDVAEYVSPERRPLPSFDSDSDKRSLYYRHVPKGFSENLRYRLAMLEWGGKSKENARDLWVACSRDILFYLNTFVYTYDSRLVKGNQAPKLPFITYPYQDAVLMSLLGAVGEHDVLVEKSRDMGASWMLLMLIEWMWHFSEFPVTFLCVSRKEDLVDRKGDPDCLFWKLDFILSHQPGWLRPLMERKSMHFGNEDTGSTIDGDSTTGDVARGGRRTAIILDEFASVENGQEVLSATADATNCRLFNSTPKGVGNAFYNIRQTCEDVLTLHWSVHPVKAAGLSYGQDGKPTSPWYEAEVKRRNNKMEVAQELDIDYLASDYQFFDPVYIQAILDRDVREPFRRGDLEYDVESARPSGFVERMDGLMLLWMNDIEHRERTTFVCGADIATGSVDSTGRGASNSVLSVADKKTGEKVCELAVSGMDPMRFGVLAVALCRWFKGEDELGAFLIWETNGPGQLFGRSVMDLGYRNIFYRRNEESLSARVSDLPGWFSSGKSKLALLGDYRTSLGRTFINRSRSAVSECRFYIQTISGAISHSKSVHTDNPTQAREQHGDRVIADALASRGLREVGRIEKKQERIIPPGSLLWRREQRLKRTKADQYW